MGWLDALAAIFSFKKPSATAAPKVSPRAVEVPPVKISLMEELAKEAERWVGVRELGYNKGPEVEMFQRAIDGRAAGEPWCAAFVQFCLKQVCSSRNAAHQIFYTEHCRTLWNKTPLTARVTKPTRGCLIVWGYRGTPSGHIGIVVKTGDNKVIETVEGNTSAELTAVAGEGDGVYRKTRSVNGTAKMEVLGFLQPFT